MENVSKIKKVSAADQVYTQLKTFILEGHWVPGEKIATETELAKSLGVNRLTVRVALQRLAALGLLDIRVGDGTYVKEFDMNEKITEVSQINVKEETMHDTGEYRRLLEMAFIDLSVQRRSDEQLDEFYKLCCTFHDDLKDFYTCCEPEHANAAFLRSVDTASDLHSLLCKMAHNQMLAYAFSLCKEPLRKHMEFNAKRRASDIDADQCNIWEKRWFQLYDALKSQNIAASRELLSQIIDS